MDEIEKSSNSHRIEPFYLNRVELIEKDSTMIQEDSSIIRKDSLMIVKDSSMIIRRCLYTAYNPFLSYLCFYSLLRCLTSPCWIWLLERKLIYLSIRFLISIARALATYLSIVFLLLFFFYFFLFFFVLLPVLNPRSYDGARIFFFRCFGPSYASHRT